ncbi:MAG: hypothetical protein J7497_06850, partial [Chitinophagaceae bacterium]|nr:hypothetical protein [Chitinophagaceae bacterium]
IPVFGMIYQFKIFTSISDSIARQLSAEDETDWLSGGVVSATDRPTYKLGLTCGILWCCSIIQVPVLQQIISLATIVCWVMYWIELRKYYKIIKERTLSA